MDEISCLCAIGDFQRCFKAASEWMAACSDGDSGEEWSRMLHVMFKAHLRINRSPMQLPRRTDKDLREALGLLAIVCLEQRKDICADDIVRRAEQIEKSTESHTTLLCLAEVFRALGVIEHSFDLVRRHPPYDVDAQLLIVGLLMDINRPDAALVRLEQLRSVVGEDDVRMQVAEAEVKCLSKEERSVKDALYTCQELVEQLCQGRCAPKLALIQAICLERLGRLDEAVKLTSASLAPQSAAALPDLLANVLFLAAQPSGSDTLNAIEWKEKLQTVDPSHPVLIALQAARHEFASAEF